MSQLCLICVQRENLKFSKVQSSAQGHTASEEVEPRVSRFFTAMPEFQRPWHQGAAVTGVIPGTAVLERRVLAASTLCQGASQGSCLVIGGTGALAI